MENEITIKYEPMWSSENEAAAEGQLSDTVAIKMEFAREDTASIKQESDRDILRAAGETSKPVAIVFPSIKKELVNDDTASTEEGSEQNVRDDPRVTSVPSSQSIPRSTGKRVRKRPHVEGEEDLRHIIEKKTRERLAEVRMMHKVMEEEHKVMKEEHKLRMEYLREEAKLCALKLEFAKLKNQILEEKMK